MIYVNNKLAKIVSVKFSSEESLYIGIRGKAGIYKENIDLGKIVDAVNSTEEPGICFTDDTNGGGIFVPLSSVEWVEYEYVEED